MSGRRNEDLALLLAGVLLGFSLGQELTGVPEYAPLVCLFLGLLLITGVFVHRIREDRPPSVRVGPGLRRISSEFSARSARVVVEVRWSLYGGLLLDCDPRGSKVRVEAVATLRRSDGLRRSVDLFPISDDLAIWIPLGDRDSETGERVKSRVELTITSDETLRRVRIRRAGKWRLRLMSRRKSH